MTKNEDTGGLVDCSQRGIIDIIYCKKTDTIRHKSNICLIDFNEVGQAQYYTTNPKNPQFWPLDGKYKEAIDNSIMFYNKSPELWGENSEVNKWQLVHLILGYQKRLRDAKKELSKWAKSYLYSINDTAYSSRD